MKTARVDGRVIPVFLAFAAFFAPAHDISAQQARQGAFVVLVGADTFAVEKFSRGPDALTSELSGASIGVIQFSAIPGADASVRDLTLNYWMPGADADGTATQGAHLTVDGDTIILDITTPPGVQVQRLPTRDNAFLYIHPSFLLIEQMVRHARVTGGEVVDIPVFMAQDGDTAPIRITSPGSESVTIFIGAQIQATMDIDGLLRSAAIPGQGLSIIRVDGPFP
jgi:hypothetical protein